MQESMTQAFVRTARAKGLTEPAVRRQAWRSALLPVITVTGLMLPALITGAVFVERVFSWPGMGFAMIRAIEARDYPVVSAGVILGSAVTALGAALADLEHAVDSQLVALHHLRVDLLKRTIQAGKLLGDQVVG